MRLVPTSNPTAELLTLSLCLMMIIAGGSRSLERRQYLLVLLSKNCSVTGHGNAARGGLRLHLSFGQSKTLPEANTRSMHERGVVIEPKGINAGRRHGIVVRQAEIVEGKNIRPVRVGHPQHVVVVPRE